MPISLALRGQHADDVRADAAWAAALASLREADRVFSTYRTGSVISRLDRGDLALADCPAEVAEVLAIAEQARVESDGAFDVRRPGEDGTVRLDPSGVVKGWAVQRAAAALAVLEDTDFCLSAGGDMVCRSQSPTSPGWRIGIEDPHEPGRIVAVVPVRNGAVATSGTAHRGDHIEDPRTGKAPAALASVTVIGDDLTWVDIEATAAFVLGDGAATWLAGRAGRTGLIVYADGRTELVGSAEDVC
ncbi:FAD:protein FMN transferase [Nocardioides marmorisolisilvae]|uniref:FAD:protein FMN transferase n=1 Tax=Nocardioides marmorisolisilvae TaxID=1542737 RepID=A0A3N0DXI8_9ACTN|nr:FAD:protein FMN transferase [Nocardioides marmorisolisilvae]RNL80334.1 FAD:protein FMN transferase [Nocardioides marmorisolisilvae]